MIYLVCPTRPCSRCGRPTENRQRQTETMLGRYIRGRIASVVICLDCRELRHIDAQKFWQEGWESLKSEP